MESILYSNSDGTKGVYYNPERFVTSGLEGNCTILRRIVLTPSQIELIEKATYSEVDSILSGWMKKYQIIP